MRRASKLTLPILIVGLWGVIPAISRVDRFPLSTHPMFSEKLNKDSVAAFQVYFRRPDGKEWRVPIFCHKLAIYLLNRNLAEKNFSVVEKTIRAIVLDHLDAHEAGALILYRAQSVPGQKDPNIKKEYEMGYPGV